MADRLARWISVLFDSSFVSIPVFFSFGWITAEVAGLVWAGLILLIISGIPLAYLILGKQLGWVSDLEMTQRSERPRFILISLSSDLLALAILYFFHGPPLLLVMVLTYLCLGVTMLTISNFWKISLHMAGVSGFSMALVFVFGAPPLVWAGNPGAPTPEELFMPCVMSWMQESVVDLATCGSITRVVSVFPNEKSCLRFITAVLMEAKEEFEFGRIYLEMDSGLLIKT